MNVWATEVQYVSALGFTGDGRALAVIGTSGSGLFGVPDGQKLQPLPLTGWLQVWGCEDRLLVMNSGFAVLGPDEPEPTRVTFRGQQVIAASPDGQTVITAAEKVLMVPVHRAFALPSEEPELVPTPTPVLAVRDRRGKVWRQRWAAEQSEAAANTAATSPDAALLASAVRGRDEVRVWEAKAGRLVRTLSARRVVDLAFAPGRLLAYSRAGLYIWDADDWDRPPRFVYGGPHERLDALAVHPDGQRAFLTNFARTVMEVDLASGTVRITMDWGVPLLSRVAVSPDGTLAAAANHGGQVVLWDLDP